MLPALTFAGAAAAGFLLWILFNRRQHNASNPLQKQTNADDADEAPLSVVALMSELPFLDLDVLARTMTSAYGIDFDNADPSDDDSDSGEAELRFADGDNFAMATPMGSYMVRLNGHMHGVIAHNEPYFEDTDAAVDSVADLRGKQAIAEHNCWLAVDHVGDTPADNELQAVYSRLGSLLLQLIDPTLCKAILLPRHQRFYPWRDEMEEALASGDVIGELSDAAHVPVTAIDQNSEEMKHAVAEAKQHWPNFVTAFDEKSGSGFGVKFLLPGDNEDSCEFPWMEVTKIHGRIIQGRLANEPIGRNDLHEGSLVTTNLDDLNDWLFIDSNGQQQGGFTIPVLMKGLNSADAD